MYKDKVVEPVIIKSLRRDSAEWRALVHTKVRPQEIPGDDNVANLWIEVYFERGTRNFSDGSILGNAMIPVRSRRCARGRRAQAVQCNAARGSHATIRGVRCMAVESLELLCG